MLSWLVYFVNRLVYKPNFQILFREVLAKSPARPKMSLGKNLFTYFKRKYDTPHEERATNSHIIFHKKHEDIMNRLTSMAFIPSV